MFVPEFVEGGGKEWAGLDCVPTAGENRYCTWIAANFFA